MTARFRIVACLDLARPQAGTVTIDRARGLFSVRPLRRHREYVLPLADVAAMVVSRIIKNEVAEARVTKKRRAR